MMTQCVPSMKTNTIKAKAKSNRVASKKTNTTKATAQMAESSLLSPQLSKTRMCVFNLRGTCKMGSNCDFAHAVEELKPLPDMSRTRLCPVLFQTGRCNAKNCTYAHSQEELVTDSCHKTKFCRFWQVGKCINGAKCRFAHSADELKDEVGVTGKPQQQDQQYNNSMAIPAIFERPPVQAVYPVTPQHLIANGQEVPPVQAVYPVTPQHLIANGQEVLICAYKVPICAYDLPRTQEDTCSPCNLSPQQSKDDSSDEDQEWKPPSELELTRGASASTQDSDGLKSYSTFSDGSESEVETASLWSCDFGPDSHDSSAPDFPLKYKEADFPPKYEEGQEPIKMSPRSNLEGSRATPKKLEDLMTELDKIASDLQELQGLVPSMGHLPVPLGRVQQPSAIENDTGDLIDHYTGAVENMQAIIDHYTGAVENMQAPLADETPPTSLGDDDDDDEDDDIWQPLNRAFLATNYYQVKNTFITVKEEPTYYPLRRVRSAAGRFSEIDNHA